jgi:hypothetical protein
VLNLRDPLYRNQEEFAELIVATKEFATGVNAAHECEDELVAFTNQIKFQRLYMYPLVKKVYGIEIKNNDEFNAFCMRMILEGMGHARGLIQGQGQGMQASGGKAERGKEWSLGTPKKEDEFWEWFEAEDTGKPVVTEKETKEGPMAKKIRKLVAEKKEGRKNGGNKEGRQ